MHHGPRVLQPACSHKEGCLGLTNGLVYLSPPIASAPDQTIKNRSQNVHPFRVSSIRPGLARTLPSTRLRLRRWPEGTGWNEPHTRHSVETPPHGIPECGGQNDVHSNPSAPTGRRPTLMGSLCQTVFTIDLKRTMQKQINE